MNKNIYVTEPSLPPLKEFISYLEKIWENKWLTNNGEFHQKFERELAEYLGVKYISLFCNGMIALQIALQALKVTGEVITTPYTFAATTHSIYWNRCTPVFCDINENDFNIDPELIESLITPDTTAIMPVHVYGNPCDNDKLQRICDTYGLKLIYDAAHAFGVKKDGKTILNWGDISMLSFHATKCFNTFEGGALITNDLKVKNRIDYLKNFGFADETVVVAPGTNGKMNEFSAALGVLQLKHVEENITKRKKIYEFYLRGLSSVNGITLSKVLPNISYNYSYFPILVDSEKYGMDREELYQKFRSNNIFVRRYFYPLTSQFPTYRHLPSAERSKLSIAEKITEQILCLPIHLGLKSDELNKIISVIKG